MRTAHAQTHQKEHRQPRQGTTQKADAPRAGWTIAFPNRIADGPAASLFPIAPAAWKSKNRERRCLLRSQFFIQILVQFAFAKQRLASADKNAYEVHIRLLFRSQRTHGVGGCR